MRLLASKIDDNDLGDDNFVIPDDVTFDLSWKVSDGFGGDDDDDDDETISSDQTSDNLSLLTVPELKDVLRAKGLAVSGKKAELIERITEAESSQPASAESSLPTSAPVSAGSTDGLNIDLTWKPSDGFGDEDDGIAGDDMDARLAAAATTESKSGGRKGADDWFDGEESSRANDYKVVLKQSQCAGCGVKLQFKDSTLPGYLPDHVYNERVTKLTAGEGAVGAPAKGGSGRGALRTVSMSGEEADFEEEKEEEGEEPVICQRCHRLRNYGVVDQGLRPGWSQHDSLNPKFFDQLLKQVRDKRCVVVTLIDAFDFHGSILPDLATVVGRNPLFVAVNKVDLLPSDYQPVRVKQWVLDECRDFAGLERLRIHDVHLVSAKTGQGVANLMDEARELARQRGCNIYVVGAANVGKSSLLNKLSDADGGQSFGGGATRKGKKKGLGQFGKKKKQGITTSALPGTTLNFLRMEVGDGVALFDTPGLILSHQFTSLLSSDELKQVVPLGVVKPVALRLQEGKAVLLGGLARVEFTHGRPFFLTFFSAPGLTLHPSSSTGADALKFMVKHSGGILAPPSSPERAQELHSADGSQLVEHVIHVQGNGWVEASCDVVLSGLGWFSVTGVGSCTLTVVAPRGVMVVQRDALMPFEARDNMGKSTGGRIVQRGGANKGPKGPPKNLRR